MFVAGHLRGARIPARSSPRSAGRVASVSIHVIIIVHVKTVGRENLSRHQIRIFIYTDVVHPD